MYYSDFFENIHAAQSLFAQNSSLQICAFRCRRVQSPESPLCMELHRPEAVRAGAFSRIPCLRCEIAHLSGSAFLYLARDKIPPAGTAPAGGMTRSGRRCWRFYNKYFKILDNNQFEIFKYYKIYKVYETDNFFYLYTNRTHSFLINKNNFLVRYTY